MSRARLRRDREDGAFESLRKAASSGDRPDGEDLTKLGLGLDIKAGS